MFGLAKFIIPWLGDDVRICDLTFDYLVLMLCSHVAARYGNVQLSARAGWWLAAVAKAACRGDSSMLDCTEHLRLSTLAKECGLSVSHFCRSFKQSFGVSVTSLCDSPSSRTSQSLSLRNSSMPLAEIALRSGFSDQAAFSRTFSSL